MYMTETVGTAELRQNLSAYLRRVERGERLVVTDRNRPVATLAPLGEAPGLARLLAEGLVSTPEQPLEIKPVKLSRDSAGTRALEDVRGEHDF